MADQGLCFLWNLLSKEEVAGKSRTGNRLRRAVLKIRARISHAVEQHIVPAATTKSLGARMAVGNAEHMVLRRRYFEALDSGAITRSEYLEAVAIIGTTPAHLNGRELAERIAVAELATGLLKKR